MKKTLQTPAKILAIAWNDIRIEFSERSTLVFFLLLPLIFTAVIGVSLQNMYGGSTDPDADRRFILLVADEDQSELSAALIESLQTSSVMRPVLRTPAEAQELFVENELPALLSIPAGFETALLENRAVSLSLTLNPESSQALAVSQAVQAAAGKIGSAAAIAHTSLAAAADARPFESQLARQAYFTQALGSARQRLEEPPARVEVSQSELVTVEIASGFEQSSPGQLVTWTMITLVGAAEVFVNERLGGTLRRLLVTPTRKTSILTGKVLGRLALGLLQMVILIGFGALFLNVNWGRSPAALALVVVCFALAAVALGVMLGTFARTRGQASGLTILFSMLLSALGGAWWPLEITPPAYQTVVKALPTTWAMMGFSDVILRGQGLAGVWTEAVVLLGFAVLFFTVGIARLRFE